MVGQGSPLGDRSAIRFRTVHCACLALLVLCSLLTTPGAAQTSRRDAPPLGLRIRVKWGYEKPRAWQGVIEVSNGEVLEMRRLGPSADSAASYRLRDGRVEIDELTPRTQSEIEILVQSTRDAELVVHLEENTESALQRQAAIPLAALIGKPAQLEAADDAPWLSASRAPGDALRIAFENGKRIYSAGETATVSIAPHEVLADPSSMTLPLQLRAELKLVSLKTQQEVWYERRELESDAVGNLPSLPPIEVMLPRDEGAYEFVVKLENRRFLSSGFAPIEQKQTLVVLADQAPGRSDTAWRTVMEIDPTVRSWWDSLRVLPSIKGIPGLSAPATPVASAKTGVVSRGGRKWAALPAGAWQAIPLSAQGIGEPHIVQIELPCDESTVPKILLLEQRASGQVVSVGLDAGGILSRELSIERLSAEKPETRVASLVYWPASPTAWLVVASQNKQDASESFFGSVRHVAGPSQLLGAVNRSDRERVVALELPADRWREQLGADFSAPSGSTEAYYQATVRLASYLRARNYNTTRLLIASGGKSLYPSEHFDSPTHHGGEIDAVELLLRVLARERLWLISEFAFNSPLAQLETLRDSTDQIVPGADMIMKSGTAVRLAGMDPSGVGPLYNPLDSEVQSAMRSPLEDFLDRYAHHESFGGIAMRLSPDCFSRLPNEDWGKDSPTLDKFAANLERVRQDPKGRPNQRANFVQPDKRDAWLTWRSQELCVFYDWLQRQVKEARPDAQLYLPLGGLLEGQASEQKIRDSLLGATGASLRDIWLAAGIDPASWRALRETVFLLPNHLEGDSSPLSRLYSAAETSEDWRQFGSSFWRAGAAAHTQEVLVHLSGFSQRGPFRGLTAESFAAFSLRPYACANPLIDGLEVSDPFAISVDLSPSPSHSNQPSVDWVDIFRRLPPVMMEPVALRGASNSGGAIPSAPIVIRHKTIASRTWFYAVNPCPFPVTITIDFQAPPGAKLESLGTKKLPPLQSIGQAVSWSYTLAPREMVGGAINSSKSKLLSYSTMVDRGIVVQMSQELAALKKRLLKANQSANRNYAVLINPEFEGEPGSILEGDGGWELISGDPAGAVIITDNIGPEGTCLRISSRGGVTSLRSQVIPYPKSQRLLFSIDLRTDASVDRSPEVKLVIEGESNGRPFIRRATVNRAKTIDSSWRNIRFEIDYLPEVSNLRVGVDLCSSDVIYIDRAALSDFWCSKEESQGVLKELAVAVHELEEGRVTSAQRLLGGYLPNYLREQVDQGAARTPQHIAMPPQGAKSAPNADRSLQDRMKEILPIPKNLIQRR